MVLKACISLNSRQKILMDYKSTGQVPDFIYLPEKFSKFKKKPNYSP
jgi:hypothetical protein